jgi:threonyl-tRNA synthetase
VRADQLARFRGAAPKSRQLGCRFAGRGRRGSLAASAKTGRQENLHIVSATETVQNLDKEQKLYNIRHGLAHVMAQAVLEMFPEGKIAIGPPIDNGFYYDFDLPRTLTDADLEAIEKRMKNILKKKHPFHYREISLEEARELFAKQPYKLELIEGLEGKDAVISTYKHDTFEDLCKGPHCKSLGEIHPKAFKLTHVAGAYWRGDEKREQLQRIYGTAWETPEELQEYLAMLEEAKKRDHRKLGRELDLFSSESDEMGGGLILWHPRGGLMKHLIEMFYRSTHLENGYDLISTPHIGRANLWETSGHLGFYADGMYSPMDIDGQPYYLKPMNCPFHILIYNANLHSYREFPIRYAEWGTVYRYERSGTLHGLLRVRGFTQDDAHHFVRRDQLADEIDFILAFSLYTLKCFGFDQVKAYLSTKPAEKSVGDAKDWEDAEHFLEEALKRAGMDYGVDEGGGAFYGPKIKDAIGREWQLSTIQVDFNLPERFDMTYTGSDGEKHRPYMIHRALLGSLERFFGVLIEHHAGAFPLWLSPIQVRLIPITDRHVAHCENLCARLKKAGFRAEVDDSSERMGNKIRKAQNLKVPIMLVVGDEEEKQNGAAVRLRSGEDLKVMSIDAIIELMRKQAADEMPEPPVLPVVK